MKILAWFVLLTLAYCASLLMTGCSSGSGKSGASGTGGTAGAFTFEQRTAILEAIGKQYESLAHQSRASDNQAMLVYLQSRKDLRAVQLTPSGTIAARFTDGPGFVFDNTLDDTGDGDGTTRTTVSHAVGKAAPIRSRRSANELPQGGNIVLLNGLSVLPGTGLLGLAKEFVNQASADSHLNKVKDIFGAAGYQATKDFASIDRLRSVKQADVLYFIGHGGLGIDENDKQIYVINSSDSVYQKSLDTTLQADIQASRVGYELFTGTINANGQKLRRWKAAYYITPKFVRENMSFNSNSFVFINGCAGAPPMGASFQQAFFDVKASAYAAWDDKVNAGDVRDTAEFLFDRLASANLSDVTQVKQDPPVRAFPFSLVQQEMRETMRQTQNFTLNQSLDSEPGSKLANLVITPQSADVGANTFGLLAPSIDLLMPSDQQTMLHIFGQFGNKQGKVTIANVDAAVQSWKPTEIVCALPPPEQSGSAGNVQVEVSGHQSNLVFLAMYKLTIHAVDKAAYSGTVVLEPAVSNAFYTSREVDGDLRGSTTHSGDLVAWIRADLHASRSTPGGAPQPPSSVVAEIVSSIKPTLNVKVTKWDGSGMVETTVHYAGDVPYEHRSSLLAPTGAGPVVFDGSDPRGIREAVSASIDANAHTMQFYTGLATTGLYESAEFSDVTGASTQPGGGISFHLQNTSSGPVPFHITLDDDLHIQSGSISESYSDPTIGVSGTRTFSWSGEGGGTGAPNNARSASATTAQRAIQRPTRRTPR